MKIKDNQFYDLIAQSAKYFIAVVMIICAYTWFGVVQSAIVINEWGQVLVSGTACSFCVASLIYGFWLKWDFVVLSFTITMAFLTTALYVSIYWA